MSVSVLASAEDHGSDSGRGLWARTFRLEDGCESSPILTNIKIAGRDRKRGSGLINVATALLVVLAVALYVVSISAQWGYVMQVKHDDLISWIEAASLDGGMAVFTLLALGLSRAGQAARIERLFIVLCAFGSAAMNYAAADSDSLRSALAYTLPPLFLAAVVDRTVSVIRRHYLGDDDASAWSQLGKVCLYGLRLVAAPPSTLSGARRALLAATPLPGKPTAEGSAVTVPTVIELRQRGPVRAVPVAEPVGAIERPRPARPKAARKRSGGSGGPSKTRRFLDLVTADHGDLAAIDLAQVYAISKAYAPKVGLHEGSARTALRKAILRAGGAR